MNRLGISKARGWLQEFPVVIESIGEKAAKRKACERRHEGDERGSLVDRAHGTSRRRGRYV